MTTVKELQAELAKLDEQIVDRNCKIEDIENQIDDLENEKDIIGYEIEYLERQQEKICRRIEDETVPAEQVAYWAERLTDTTMSILNGQFKCNDKWAICNGYAFIVYPEKIEGVKVVDSTDDNSGLLKTINNIIQVDLPSAVEVKKTDVEEKNDVLIGEHWFSTEYVKCATRALLMDDNAKLSIENGKLFIEQNDKLACILKRMHN